jgi:hypothetical protein
LATWTPDALRSEARRLTGSAWRIVEAQHVVSTMKLVDSLAEQHVLEEVLERSKPPVPSECRHLHYLLATPFRYGAPYPGGSRFRRAGFTPGVFYASQAVETAVAETAFRRLLFFADAPNTPWPQNAGEYTAFSVKVRARHGLDLSAGAFAADRARWTHPTDYEACQALADAARDAGIQALRYQSARATGRNVALLTCRAFAAAEPGERQTWRLHLSSAGVRGACDHPRARLEFDRLSFARDPRIASLRWAR